MGHKRIHIRVPVMGDVLLSCGDGVVIQADTIDISAGGIRIVDPAYALRPDMEYGVEVTTSSRGKVMFNGVLIHRGKQGIGMKIVAIDADNLRLIYQLVNDFQATGEFITHIEESNILDDWFVDENGRTVSVTFEEQ